MLNGKSILALIPVHAGREAALRKYLVEVAGSPLLAWTIAQARASAYVDAVVVMTEDPEVAQVAVQWGAEVPLNSAGQMDASASRDAQGIVWALDELAKMGRVFDYVAILEPGSPLRAPGDIDRAIGILDAEAGEVAGVMSLGGIHREHPALAKKVVGGRVVPYMHQATAAPEGVVPDHAYFPYGLVYLSRVDILRETGGFYHELMAPMFVERWQCYDVVDFYDLLCVDTILRYSQSLAQQQAARAAAQGAPEPAPLATPGAAPGPQPGAAAAAAAAVPEETAPVPPGGQAAPAAPGMPPETPVVPPGA